MSQVYLIFCKAQTNLSAISLIKTIAETFNWPENEEIEILHFDIQTPLQLANRTQLQLVGVGVDFVFPWKKVGISPT